MSERTTINLDIPREASERIAQQDADRECQCPLCGRMHRNLRAGKPPLGISALIEIAVAAERERCAQVADSMNSVSNIGDRIRYGLGRHKENDHGSI